jgi:hypothetical protein
MGSPRLRIAIKDHFREALPIADALRNAGHELVSSAPADLLLIDLDPPQFGYRELIDHHKQLGAKVLIYPHGACANLAYDGLFEPYEPVDGQLTTGSGGVELLRRLGYRRPAHAIGWSYCQRLPFRPCADVCRVVFAPTHPGGDGSMLAHLREANASVFAQLLASPWEVLVRHLGTVEQNGLWEAPGVRFVQGKLDLSHAEIDAADAVVAGYGTYPAMAVARGVPTVMYGQCVPSGYGIEGEPVVPLRSLHRYEHLVRYPIDVADGPLDEVLDAAARDDRVIADWRRRWIGEPFDGPTVAALIERLVRGGEPVPSLQDARGFVTVAFAEEIYEHPELLAAYVRHFGPKDDATLVLWAPGVPARQLLADVQATAARAGLELDGLPDVLLMPDGDLSAIDGLLAEGGAAVLSAWPRAGRLGALPAFDAQHLPGLRRCSRALRQRSSAPSEPLKSGGHQPPIEVFPLSI